MITLREMRALAALDDHATLTAAAEALHISQPALTQTLSGLETRLGAPLFDRTRRRLEFTDLGRRVLERARRLLREADDLQTEVEAFRAGGAGDLRLGVGPFVETALLPDALACFFAGGRQVRLQVRSGASAALLAQLAGGRLDLVVADLAPEDLPPDITITPLPPEGLGLAVRPDHPVRLRGADPAGFPGASATPPARMPRAVRIGGAHIGLSLICDDYEVLAQSCAVSDHILIAPSRILERLCASAGLVGLSTELDLPPVHPAIAMRTHAPVNPARDALAAAFAGHSSQTNASRRDLPPAPAPR